MLGAQILLKWYSGPNLNKTRNWKQTEFVAGPVSFKRGSRGDQEKVGLKAVELFGYIDSDVTIGVPMCNDIGQTIGREEYR